MQVSSEGAAAASGCMEEMTAVLEAQQRELESLRAATAQRGQATRNLGLGREGEQPPSLLRCKCSIPTATSREENLGAAAAKSSAVFYFPEDNAKVNPTGKTGLGPDKRRSVKSTVGERSAVDGLESRNLEEQAENSTNISCRPSMERSEDEPVVANEVAINSTEDKATTEKKELTALFSKDVETGEPKVGIFTTLNGRSFSTECTRMVGLREIGVQMVLSAGGPKRKSYSEAVRAKRSQKLLEWLLTTFDQPRIPPPYLPPQKNDVCMCDRLDLETLRSEISAALAARTTAVTSTVKSLIPKNAYEALSTDRAKYESKDNCTEKEKVEEKGREKEWQRKKSAWEARTAAVEEEIERLRVENQTWKKEAVSLRTEVKGRVERVLELELDAREKVGFFVNDTCTREFLCFKYYLYCNHVPAF